MITEVGEDGYNGSFNVTVTSPTQFTYPSPNLSPSGGGFVYNKKLLDELQELFKIRYGGAGQAKQELRQTAQRLGTIHSGDLLLRLVVTPLNGSTSGRIGFVLAGPFSIRAGALPSAAGDGRIAWIDPADVAGVATAVLLEAGYAGQVLKMTGPKALTYDDAAAALERTLGRPVAHLRMQEQEVRAQLTSFGLPSWMIDSFLGQHRLMREGRLSLVNDVVPDVLGRPARDLDQWLAENKDAFAA